MGKTPGSGRKAGTPNKIHSKARDNIMNVFSMLGGIPAMLEWAKEHPTDFYTKIYTRLLPVEMKSRVYIPPEPEKTVEESDREVAKRLLFLINRGLSEAPGPLIEHKGEENAKG